MPRLYPVEKSGYYECSSYFEEPMTSLFPFTRFIIKVNKPQRYIFVLFFFILLILIENLPPSTNSSPITPNLAISSPLRLDLQHVKFVILLLNNSTSAIEVNQVLASLDEMRSFNKIRLIKSRQK